MVSTRLTTSRSATPSIDCDRATEITETLADRRRRWSQLLRNKHYEPIIAEVLDDELSKYQESTAIGGIERVFHMRECALILSSAPSVLAAAVEGNLVSRMLTDTNLQREYAVVQQHAHEQPSIYVHLLADELGTPPTPNQYLLVRDIVLDYLSYGSTSVYAYRLDNITRPTVTLEVSSLGHRKYLQTKSSTRSTKRVDAFQRFCSGILARWTSTPAFRRDTPFPYPPGECGYSISSHTRLAQHRAHNSSNYIMNLVEDIFTHLHRTGTLSQNFTMHPFIIYLIFRPRQAAIAEVFCSGLLQVWVDDGGGFNAYPAGLSVASAKRVTGHKWERHVRSAKDNSPVVENMRGQMERVKQWRRALDLEEVLEGDMDGEDEDVDEI
ncbi:hypothetical protein J1614_006584 [Plenodomus biglobosus]|nr:hypothetical protein J1614_006584 [Plenodomus biglobosus]